MTADNNVTPEARVGLITAIGIILGFTLTFFGQWSTPTNLKKSAESAASIPASQTNPAATQVPGGPPPCNPRCPTDDEWCRKDLPAIITMLVGVLFLIYSLRQALKLSTDAAHYNRTVKFFMWGIGTALLGFVFAIFTNRFFGFLDKC